jgi:hypothetical protein
MSGPRPGYPETASTPLSAQERIGGIYDGVRIAPDLDEHSDAPLKYWRDHLKRKLPREQPKPEKTAPQNDDKPAGSIDEYA